MDERQHRAMTLAKYLWRLNQRFRRINEGFCQADCDLSPVESNALGYLGQHGPCRMSDLADHLGLALSSTTAVVDRLETKGQALRERDESDRRVVLVGLSETGRDAFEHWSDIYVRFCADALDRLSESDQKRLLTIFGKISAG